MKRIYLVFALLGILGCHVFNSTHGPDPLIKDLTPRIEKLRELTFKSTVQVGRKSPSEVRKYLDERISQEYTPAELENERKVYVLFNILPETFPYKETVLRLLSGQIAGYYDPFRKTLFLSNKNRPEEVKEIAAHELTHALQDQYFDLKKLIDIRPKNDDRSMALNAVLEGEAMAIMTDFALNAKEIQVAYSPGLIEAMKKQTMQAKESDPELKALPKIFLESLLFPYAEGFGFIQFMREKKGWTGVTEIYSDLPTTTEQILHPEKYFPKKEPPLVVAEEDLAMLGFSRKAISTNIMGELGVKLIFGTKLPEGESAAAAEGWGGDRYWLLSDKELVWWTKWDSEKDAQEFTKAWKKAELVAGSSIDNKGKDVVIGLGTPVHLN